ncbi:hypothetical protein N9F08_00160 [bacterium]|nr:hypothetical protein [bacterium]
MSQEPNNIYRLVREKLDGFKMSPPPDVWNTTVAALPKKMKKGLFFGFILGAAFIVFSTLSVCYFNRIDSTENQLANESSSRNKMELPSLGTKENTIQSSIDSGYTTKNVSGDFVVKANDQNAITNKNSHQNLSTTAASRIVTTQRKRPNDKQSLSKSLKSNPSKKVNTQQNKSTSYNTTSISATGQNQMNSTNDLKPTIALEEQADKNNDALISELFKVLQYLQLNCLRQRIRN